MKRTLGLMLSVLLLAVSPSMAEEITATYMYTLSDFNGPLPYNWVSFAADQERRETYVADSAEKTVRVFNESGMEIYRFGDDGAFGTITGVAVGTGGEIFVLSRTGSSYAVTRCNFRGQPQGRLALNPLPAEFLKSFQPDLVLHRLGQLYLVDRSSMKVVVAKNDGTVEKSYDLAGILGLDEKKRRDLDIGSLTVDGKGNLLFTVPALFSAYVLSPDQKLQNFGMRGSSPGKFNVVNGIAADDRGLIYLSDTLRCVVMVFDQDLKYRMEFGYRGEEPGNLIAPMELTVNNDRVYVTQTRSRGVSVYRIFRN